MNHSVQQLAASANSYTRKAQPAVTKTEAAEAEIATQAELGASFLKIGSNKYRLKI